MLKTREERVGGLPKGGRGGAWEYLLYAIVSANSAALAISFFGKLIWDLSIFGVSAEEGIFIG